MSKRLTDTNKWSKRFFRELDDKQKLFWLYLLDHCNHAGIWEVFIDDANLRINCKFTEKELKKIFSEKIISFDNNKKWFIPSFIEFQYKTELNLLNSCHYSVIEILNKYDLFKYLPDIKVIKRGKGVNKKIKRGFKGATVGAIIGATIGDKDKRKDIEKEEDKIQDENNLIYINSNIDDPFEDNDNYTDDMNDLIKDIK